MDTSRHTIQTLFRQLGIPHSEPAIEAFLKNNHLPPDIPLKEAAFWNGAQAQFIRDAIAEDADWAEVVDQLDALLRH